MRTIDQDTPEKSKKDTDKKKPDISHEDDEGSRTVLPGDHIGITEEFASGEGTYSLAGDIYANRTGKVHVNKKDRKISVVPITSVPPVINKGDIVIGEIVNVRDSVAIVSISSIKGSSEREFMSDDNFVIHISDVKDSYVKDLSREFSLGDVVKAKVIDTEKMRLTTSDDSLGVMTSRCSKCHGILRMEDKNLKCPSCGRIEHRKLSKDYGTGVV
ncbi:RNA binding protein [Methanosalsum zhilinae DSM 4017]|uniref:Exosome complex component Csl4 n=1 Tax=Methanosalsum zhilinae (strain DSM 4017 / NBRC 107636 / OCM 62 / WeN5) TaxID=679901 RepID=F7XQS4_METZD|nr:exosome complex RNA-binding protein Csl4 [Methanosalsum zhilinae]AEH61679.1 RNA binding protein [Methanosalsum zhilinae DSM 4017]